jgi:protein-S-isoprenylcysteine O-methyltransferase Ste14
MALKDEFKKQGDFLFRHRSNLPLIIIVVGLAVYFYGKHTGDSCLNSMNCEFLKNNWLFICFAIGALGVFIRAHVVGYSADNTSGRNTKVGQVASCVNSTGMYSMMRHPLYLGNFFMWLAVALLTENAWFVVSFILFYMLYYERIMYAEETFLIDKFKEGYTDWSKNTPAIIPSLGSYQKPDVKFDWVKVFKKEKNGILALFLLFWFFDLLGKYVETSEVSLEYNFWFIGTMVSLLYYAVVKIIRKLK